MPEVPRGPTMRHPRPALTVQARECAVVITVKIGAQPGSLVAAPNRRKYNGSKPHGCVRGGLSTDLSTRRWILPIACQYITAGENMLPCGEAELRHFGPIVTPPSTPPW